MAAASAVPAGLCLKHSVVVTTAVQKMEEWNLCAEAREKLVDGLGDVRYCLTRIDIGETYPEQQKALKFAVTCVWYLMGAVCQWHLEDIPDQLCAVPLPHMSSDVWTLPTTTHMAFFLDGVRSSLRFFAEHEALLDGELWSWLVNYFVLLDLELSRSEQDTMA